MGDDTALPEGFPPPPDHYPDYVKRVYAAGCRKVAEYRKQLDAGGVLALPFRCYVCEKEGTRLGTINMDRVPVCVDCMGGPEVCAQAAREGW